MEVFTLIYPVNKKKSYENMDVINDWKYVW